MGSNLENDFTLNDSSYSSDEDLISKFLKIKSQKSLSLSRNDENFECTKVVEVFITKDGKIFAQCSICLYKTEIENMNYLLKHFIDNHAICRIVQNVENLITNYKNRDEPEIFESKYNNTEGLNFMNNIEIENVHQQTEIKAICAIPSDMFEAENLKFENVSDQSSSSCVEELFELNKLTSLKNDFENNIIDFDENESNNEYITECKDEYCDSIILEEKMLDNKLIKSIDACEENPNFDISNQSDAQKSDEEFYQKLAGLSSDQSLCHICNIKFRHISRHYKNRHPEIILCEIGKCFQTFNTLPELNIHQERFHNDPDHAFTCIICSYKTNNLYSFRFHYQRVHLNIKGFDCDFCDMKFFSNYEKVKHMRSHTGQKPYNCKLCNSKYPTKQQLNLHIQKYHSEPLFDCKICNKKFHRQQTLKEHQMTKHAENEKKVICEICGDRFFLKKHKRDHFNNIHNPDRKRWTCTDCGKSFSRNSNLRYHKAIHNLED
ncbi:zinc finger protein 484-like [Condylostylus longicornis]|uniref:zinc finger protein 484-like n=1 Tax=Condylostylus longicornis TaxID=2530218 RepID=UPI00244E0EED|nr:zinc finger protein 484-like [Condylostylus longicornis]